jgi:hypothetical protein
MILWRRMKTWVNLEHSLKIETEQPNIPDPPQNEPSTQWPDWWKCGCCKLKSCIALTSRFAKLCLDPDVLQLCIRNSSDIRNDQEDHSTRAFRKAAYRQFILARHGHLGKGNRRVCPSCVVLKIRLRDPKNSAKLIWQMIIKIYVDSHNVRNRIDASIRKLFGFVFVYYKPRQ